MSGALQAIFQNLRSFTEPLPTVIGQAYGGGYYAGQIGVSSVATHYLIVGPVSSAQSSSKTYKTTNSSDSTPTSVIDGPSNSTTINDAAHPAAEFCEAVTAGGFTDWYMPAKNELEVCYYNLKPTTDSNLTSPGSGINANAVPSRGSNYTSGTPAQTSVAIFQTGNAQAFGSGGYWSSSQSTTNGGRAWKQFFYSGYQFTDSKNAADSVRAVRRVAV